MKSHCCWSRVIWNLTCVQVIRLNTNKHSQTSPEPRHADFIVFIRFLNIPLWDFCFHSVHWRWVNFGFGSDSMKQTDSQWCNSRVFVLICSDTEFHKMWVKRPFNQKFCLLRVRMLKCVCSSTCCRLLKGKSIKHHIMRHALLPPCIKWLKAHC